MAERKENHADTHMKVNEVATTCLDLPATLPDMMAKLRTATAPNPWVQLQGLFEKTFNVRVKSNAY